MNEKRKLSTVLFADIAGYTSLMQTDEKQAMLFLKDFKEILEKIVLLNNGEIILKTKDELIEKWNDGWKCLFDTLDSVSEDNFETKIYIRNQEHSILEAINRQLAHYPYHIGQIVYIGKMAKKNEWNSLTIPKGKSNEFNKEKFSKGKHKGHFSDDLKK